MVVQEDVGPELAESEQMLGIFDQAAKVALERMELFAPDHKLGERQVIRDNGVVSIVWHVTTPLDS